MWVGQSIAVCAWAQMCQYMWIIGPKCAEKLHHHQKAVNMKFSMGQDGFLISLQYWVQMDFPRPPTLPAWGRFSLNLMESQAGEASVVTAQLPFMINPESRLQEERTWPKSDCLAACGILVLPLGCSSALRQASGSLSRDDSTYLGWVRSLSARWPSALSLHLPSNTECSYVPSSWGTLYCLNRTITPRRLSVFFPFYWWGKWGSERFNNLPKVTQ